ncbi:hypothetical protein LPB41_00325 [Thalassospira sp. MA62]|nr:hypothetical protein [Thalassospira sp. MA62]
MKLGRRSFLTGAAATTGLLFTRPVFARDQIRIRDIYKTQAEFSDLAKSYAASGDELQIIGYMAPPLKANANFFVLTQRPMAVCPFCETSADWPTDIVFVRTEDTIETVAFNRTIVTRGILELGEAKDKDTGFVSLVRLVDAQFELL